MATLSEGLEWILKANNTQLKKGIDEGKEKVKELDKQTKKSTDSMGKGFLQVKESVEKVKGALLFYAAAVAALVTPTLKAEQSLRKLSAASLLAGQSMDKGKMIDSVKRAADAMGTTYSNAASKAATAVSTYGVTVETANQLVVKANEMAKLSTVDSAASIEAALASAAKSFKMNAGAFADQFGSKFSVAAAQAGLSVTDLVTAVGSVAVPAMKSNVNIEALIASMAGLTAGGMDLAGAQSTVNNVIRAAIDPTKDQAAAWQQFGLAQGETLVSGNGLLSLIPYLQTQMDFNKDAVEELTKAYGDLGEQFKSADGQKMADIMKAMSDSAAISAAATTEQKSTLDKISETLASLVNKLTPLSEEFMKLADLAWRFADALGAAAKWVDEMGGATLDWLTYDVVGLPKPAGMATGGSVPGHGSGDTVPAMLTPGEFVVKKSVAQRARGFLSALNNGMVRGYAFGGTASMFGGSMYKPTPFGYTNSLPWGINTILGRSGTMLGAANTMLGRSGTMLNANQPWAMGTGFGGYGGYGGFGGASSYASRFGFSQGYFGMRRYASGGEVSSSTKQSALPQSGPVGSSYSIGSMNLNFPNARISPSVVRDQILPAISRESENGRNRRARTRL